MSFSDYISCRSCRENIRCDFPQTFPSENYWNECSFNFFCGTNHHESAEVKYNNTIARRIIGNMIIQDWWLPQVHLPKLQIRFLPTFTDSWYHTMACISRRFSPSIVVWNTIPWQVSKSVENGVLGNAKFSSNQQPHSHGPWDISKDPYLLRNHLISNSSNKNDLAGSLMFLGPWGLPHWELHDFSTSMGS